MYITLSKIQLKVNSSSASKNFMQKNFRMSVCTISNFYLGLLFKTLFSL